MNTISIKQIEYVDSGQWNSFTFNKPLFQDKNNKDVYNGDIVSISFIGVDKKKIGIASNYRDIRVESFNQETKLWEYYTIEELV